MIRALTILGVLAPAGAIVLLAVDAERFGVVATGLLVASLAIGGILGIRRVLGRRREAAEVEPGVGARGPAAAPDASQGTGEGGSRSPHRTSAEEIGSAAASAGTTAGIAIDAAAEGGYHEPSPPSGDPDRARESEQAPG